jgi:pimeloyl-ACP methyl ester carboxylesterase
MITLPETNKRGKYSHAYAKFNVGYAAKRAFALWLLFMNNPLMAQDSGVKNIVLVHGAFTDGSCWSAVIALLQGRGYHVTAVQNP